MPLTLVGSWFRLCALAWLLALPGFSAEHHGQVTFGGLPVPGATVTASQGGKKLVLITDQQGDYSFPDLADGTWTLEVDMLCFETAKQEIAIGPNAPPAKWELKPLPMDQIKAAAIPAVTVRTPEAPDIASPAAPPPHPADRASAANAPAANDNTNELSQRAADGFLINGSMNNGAASPFAQFPGFGNNRSGRRSLYNGGIGLIVDNSALDARSFSLTGQDTAKPGYSRLTGVATLGGPLRIPHLLTNGPNFFVAYQWTRNSTVATQPALMPDLLQRAGDFSQNPTAIFDPVTHAPFAGNIIPQSRLSPQAMALLSYYPLPNFDGGGARYNYQLPLLTPTHQDALQSRLMKTLGRRDQVYGDFAFQNTRSDTPNIFNFLDTTDALGINTGANWSHRFGQRLIMNLGYRFSRLATHVTPYFENRENVSGAAGITGNNQDPMNWGPPSLVFSGGIAGLSDAQSSFDRNQTSALSNTMYWGHNRHNFTFGGDFRRQEFNYLSQQNPRGTFTFTGAAAGSDFADFLLGIPDASSIAFGNADKYFREPAYDAFLTDDWRISPEFTLNAGIRWEYGAPITERYGRLVNLDVTPGFAEEAPVIAPNPVGSLTGLRYPASLIRPDRSGFEPRIGIAWRPVSGSSLVVRAGYGIYYNTSVYQTIATQMAQQAPLSKSLNVSNSAADPLTLASGFNASSSTTPDTFGIDPNFRIGYAQTWQLSVQRDLPWSMQITATYLGIKGTRGTQEFLPNTFPSGAVNPCPACPAGYAYMTSNGNSTREAAQLQLRRRLHNGFTASLLYTFSKSIDDDASLGGQPSFTPQSASPQNPQGATTAPPAPASPTNLMIAQNWLDLSAERSLSSFDQRHLLTLLMQYTTGMGLGGGTLLSGWRGALFKDWNFLAQVTAGTGLPLTPVYLVPVQGTGVTGTIRPDYTGAPLYGAPAGFYLNPAAYTAPAAGQWGNAGRDSITGPGEFAFNASMGRTFRVSDRFNLDLRVDSTNALNHVTFASWNTTVTNAQFGLPTVANAMRSMQTTLRLRF